MFLLRKPTNETIRQFISAQQELPFSYAEVGATREKEAPPGYNIDHNRVKLGDSADTYERAVAALKSWRQFDLGWVTIVPSNVPVEVGRTVAVQAHTFGFWSLSACRVAYVIDEAKRFGFAYGTLPSHVECGEERFSLEWHEDGSVWYDIYAFSHPAHPLVKLGTPVARRLQRRFARDSLATIKTHALAAN